MPANFLYEYRVLMRTQKLYEAGCSYKLINTRKMRHPFSGIRTAERLTNFSSPDSAVPDLGSSTVQLLELEE